LEPKRTKIVYLINGSVVGGAEMMLYRLLQKLDRKYFAPEVLTLQKFDQPLLEKMESQNVPVKNIGMRSKLDFFAIPRLYLLLKKIQPDILHTQLFAADILGRVIGRLSKVPVIITSIRNIKYGGKLRDVLIKLTEGCTSKTTVVSTKAAKRFIQDKIIPDKKLVVIHNGIDPDYFFPGLSESEKKSNRDYLGLPVKGFLFLAVGSLTPQKGYHLLLEALADLKSRKKYFHLAVAGEGKLGNELKGFVKGKGLENEVTFLGRFDDVPQLMGSADALVLSSLWEGLPGVVLEAMASALPVIATDAGGTSEVVANGETGYLVPPGEPEALADAMEKIMSLPVRERVAMGKKGRSRVINYFHIDGMVKSYESLYYNSLKEQGLK